jgi:hypothetical protein
MKHARCQRDVERAVFERNRSAIEVREIGSAPVVCRADVETLARDVEARDAS